MSATGLRSIRYIKEVPGIKTLLVNDLEEGAVEAIRRNILFNGESASRCVPNKGDANMVMHQHRGEGKMFDIVDLDPYGTAAPFLDAAIQSVQHGGLLCVTCRTQSLKDLLSALTYGVEWGDVVPFQIAMEGWPT